MELVARGLVASREQAQGAIASGQVVVAGAPAGKANRMVAASEPIRLCGPPPRYVSRGGEKLEAALDHFGLDIRGRRCLDAGASTGGFTDCLLQRGASSVLALDVGRGQLHERLREDRRVTSAERTNLRDARLADLGGVPYEVVVADLSFISLRTVAPVLLGELAAPEAEVVVLVKPQFEAGNLDGGRAEVSRGRGVIRDPAIWLGTLRGVIAAFEACGGHATGVVASPLTGAQGNVEFLLHCRAPGDLPLGEAWLDLDAAIAEGAALAGLSSETSPASGAGLTGERA
ncbi:MAG: TlyA family RNA methyltransferase [Acidimicrobiales bacterium]